MPTSDSQILLFYSRRCNHCTRFIEEAKKIPDLSQKINMVEIERNQGKLPQWLQSVPALQTSEGVYSGEALFKWLADQSKAPELGPSPGIAGKGGFDLNPYTSLSDEEIHQNFTVIGQANGCTNVDEKKVQDHTNMDLDKLQASRQADLRDLM